MKIGIIGSGQVAQIIGVKLLELGFPVMISSRDINVEKDRGSWGKLPSAKEWVSEESKKGYKAYAGSFSDAAKFGEVIFNCTAGSASIEALSAAGKENLKGKILIDLANPLDFSKGMPPTLTISNTTSLGERIQTAFPETKVIKTLNTVNANIMINPRIIKNEHDIFICGNDNEAKNWVKKEVLIKWFGWKNIIDLGDISASRGTEMYLPLWLRLWNSTQTPNFNIHVST
jgi:predicted dinucleotide-binding enzyme